jgi:hypothetical protein
MHLHLLFKTRAQIHSNELQMEGPIQMKQRRPPVGHHTGRVRPSKEDTALARTAASILLHLPLLLNKQRHQHELQRVGQQKEPQRRLPSRHHTINLQPTKDQAATRTKAASTTRFLSRHQIIVKTVKKR